MNISIILASYKRPEILQRTLNSFHQLESDSFQWDLWVVDNAGDPETKQIVDDWNNDLPINYRVETKPGKNNALNMVIPEVRGEFIVFTDDDIIATPDWLTQLWQGACRWPEHVLFGGRILPDWPEGFKPHDLTNPFLVGTYAIADWDIPEGEYSPKRVFGANMMVKKKIFDEGWRFNCNIGPIQNTNYIMGSETEFVLRLESAGFKPIYLPKALVYHQIRPEQMRFSWLKTRALRAGKGDAKSDPVDPINNDIKVIFGYPRYLIRRTLETYLAYSLAGLFNKQKKIEFGMRFYYNLGRLSQHKKDILN